MKQVEIIFEKLLNEENRRECVNDREMCIEITRLAERAEIQIVVKKINNKDLRLDNIPVEA